MASVTIGGPVLSTEPGGLQPGRSHDWTWDFGGSTMRAVSVAVDPLTNNTVLAVGNLRFGVAADGTRTIAFTVTNVGATATNYGVSVGAIQP